jgi:PRC-barrel domain
MPIASSAEAAESASNLCDPDGHHPDEDFVLHHQNDRFSAANETVGTIDDLIVTPSEKVPFAVLSVGGFLGMGTKYVVVPYSSLQVRDKKMVLPGATKESLKELPEFKYSN